MKKIICLAFLLIFATACSNQTANKDELKPFPKQIEKQISSITGKNIKDVTKKDLLSITELRLEEPNNKESVSLDTLGQLPNLKFISISVPFTHLDSLYSLKKLKWLGIYNVDSPSIDISKLSSSLENLSFDHANLKSIHGISHLKNLKSLWISGNQLNSSDLDEIHELKALEVLYLWQNNIESLSFLENLPTLITLDLSKNNITDISPINNLTHLIYLDISKNRITDIRPINNLTHLQTLFIGSNPIEELPLSDDVQVEMIDLQNTNVSDISTLKSQLKLTRVDIRNTKVHSIAPLKELSNLTVLQLNKDAVTDWESLSKNKNLLISEKDLLTKY